MVIKTTWVRYLMPLVFLLISVIVVLVYTQFEKTDIAIVKSSQSSKGMVVTAHPLASEVGLDILKGGGNAADAAVAVQFALAVVYPRAGNIGGGGFMVYRDSSGEVTTLDYREKAPLSASRDMYLDTNGKVIDRISLDGILAAGIPGTVAGLFETHRKYGKLKDWSKLVEPAIRLAANGFHISALEARRLNDNRDAFIKFNSYEIPFVKNKPWKEGDLLKQKALANMLRAIADHGADAFYKGQNAASLDSLSRVHHGILTIKDLEAYSAVWRKPIVNHWRDCEVYSMALPSSGGIVIGQILGMIDQHLQDSLGYRNIQNLHVILEAERRAYEDRATYLGDQDFYQVPVDSLLDKTYLASRFADFNPDSAGRSILPKATSRPGLESLETTHISIVDGEGNAASVTTTLNNNYGCKVWVPWGGYFLNDEMDDFSSKPGTPNLFGLVGAEANAIAPGKRMLSSMTPTIVEKQGRLYLVLGSPGGSSIVPTVLQVFLNVEAFGMNIEEAVKAGRYFHQWLPDEITFEKDALSPALQDSLSQMGYHLHPIELIGLVEAIYVDEANSLHGVADHRGDDHASGW